MLAKKLTCNYSGGVHTASASETTGFPGLSSAVQQLGLSMTDLSTVQIDYAASSIGSLNENFLAALHAAASGKQLPVQRHEGFENLQKRTRILFPLHETVAKSKGGPNVR
jgi:hypothetical protein